MKHLASVPIAFRPYQEVVLPSEALSPGGAAPSLSGNKLSQKDARNNLTTFTYDSLNRLLTRVPHASFSAPTITFTYTPTGQRATMTDASGATTYTYNARDQVLTKATPQGTLTYSYDLSGNVPSVVSSNPNGANVSYAWDANNRLQSVTDNRTSGVTNYTYDPTNQLATVTYPNAAIHTYTYDNRDRGATLALTRSGVLANYTQTYSFSGRKTNSAESSGRNVAYSYDPIYRLLNETISGAAPNNGSLTYTLDAVGNRNSLTSTLAALSAQIFTYDANDRISGDTFDANGNTLTSGGITYTYDFEDRLLTTSSGVTNVYDGDGNRVSRTASGVTTRFLVDENNPTGWPQVAEELVSGSVVAQYTHGLMRISQNRSGTVHYYGYDDGGSVRQLLNPAGTITDTFTYDAFGNTIARTGTTVNPYQYRSEQFDSALNMYYLRARWYLPRTGRFLTQDTFEGVALTPSTAKLYLYALSNPIGHVDPSGNAAVIENAALDYQAVQRFLNYAAALSAVGLACNLTCGQNDGRWQAQGSDMDSPGGESESWNLPLPPLKVMGMLQLTALVSRLSDRQRENRMDAYSKAMKWLAGLVGGATSAHNRSFPRPTRAGMHQYWDQQPHGRRRCPDGDCRIDIEITRGVAFIF